MGQSQEMLRFGVAMALCAVACSTCESTFGLAPGSAAENCAATTMDRFSKQCNRKPSYASGFLDAVNDLSVTECGDLCLSRFACKSFTHIVGTGRCQLYAKLYRGRNYHREHNPQHDPANTKDMYRLKRCTPQCPANIMDRFARAADFRTQTVGTASSTFAYPAGYTGHDSAGQWLTAYSGGYRPQNQGGYTHHCTTTACQTVAGCAQACFNSGTTGANACKAFNFRTGQDAGEEQCKFYQVAYVPKRLMEHADKQFYHLTVGSNCV